MTINEFSKKINIAFNDHLGLTLTDWQVTAFYIYMNMLIEKNKVMNLTAITDPYEIIIRHFVDSCMPLKFYDFGNDKLLNKACAEDNCDAIQKNKIHAVDPDYIATLNKTHAVNNNGANFTDKERVLKEDRSNSLRKIRVADIGTGAGFPGLPLAIMLPQIEFVLTDSLGKRIAFLEEVISELQKLSSDNSLNENVNYQNLKDDTLHSTMYDAGCGDKNKEKCRERCRDKNEDKYRDRCGDKNEDKPKDKSGVGAVSITRLNNVKLLKQRAEDFCHDTSYRESFDFVLSRGVAKLSVLSEYCLPTLKVGGSMISYKMDDIESELNDSLHAIEILGGKFHVKHTYGLINGDPSRCLIEIQKISKTSKQYPRKAGTPSKEPL